MVLAIAIVTFSCRGTSIAIEFRHAAPRAPDLGRKRRRIFGKNIVIEVIDELAAKNPKLKTAKPEEFVDMSFVKKLDDEKFFDRLYKR